MLTAAFPVFSEFKARPVIGQNHDFVLVCRKYVRGDVKDNERHRISLSRNIEMKTINYLKSMKDSSDEGLWETKFAEILPLLSSLYVSGTKEELSKSLVKFF